MGGCGHNEGLRTWESSKRWYILVADCQARWLSCVIQYVTHAEGMNFGMNSAEDAPLWRRT